MTYANALAALAEPNRRAIVQMLHQGPRNVSSLAGDLPISRPAVSQHLKVLCDAGLLTVTPAGTHRRYALRPGGAAELRQYLDQMWGDALSAYADHIEQEVKDG